MLYSEQVRILHAINKTIVGGLVCDYSSQVFIVYAYSDVKYLHILLSCVTCVHDDVKVYV